MRRLEGTLLGLCLPRFPVSWGCPTGASEGVRRCSIVEGGRGADKSCRLSILLIICGNWGGGHFQGLVGVTVTLTCDCFSFLIRCVTGGCEAESPSPESPGGSQLYTSPQRVKWHLKNFGGHLIHLVYDPSGTKQDGMIKGHHSPYKTP